MSRIISNYSIDGNEFTRTDTQDTTAILDANQADRNSGDHDSRFSNMRKVASIPLVHVEYLKTRPWKEGGPIDLDLIGHDHEHAARFALWLNERDNRAFRTNNSRV